MSNHNNALTAYPIDLAEHEPNTLVNRIAAARAIGHGLTTADKIDTAKVARVRHAIATDPNYEADRIDMATGEVLDVIDPKQHVPTTHMSAEQADALEGECTTDA